MSKNRKRILVGWAIGAVNDDSFITIESCSLNFRSRRTRMCMGLPDEKILFTEAMARDVLYNIRDEKRKGDWQAFDGFRLVKIYKKVRIVGTRRVRA